MATVPSYLADYAGLYEMDPRGAALQWFREAKFGLFLHYGLYSLLGRHEWVQCREKIPVAQYAMLQQFFTAQRFDAEAIGDLAVEAEMKYINITTRHHDSFCLWDTQQTTFNSVEAPCGRDLVRELAEACERRGLGLCLYYSHGRDWRHPHAPNNDAYPKGARPEYDPPEPTYATGAAHDLNYYLEFMIEQVRELLTNYGPIAAIWMDGIMTPKSGDMAAFRCEELYDTIRSLQPQVLIASKSGFTGTEDFYAPELGWDFEPPDDRPVEICGCLCEEGWGYTAGAPHKTADEAYDLLMRTNARGWNLLLNTGPLPDGAIESVDADTLRTIGRRLCGEQ
jgi:alpha-L-fucosidase